MAMDDARATVAADGPKTPLVTIAIPTYNRPAALARAAQSALAQSHRHVEVLISDDASSVRELPELLAALSAQDDRIRAVRQPRNLGHAGNYDWLLEAARGEYFMWLADDDWIDPGYVERCLAELRADPGAGLVCGVARYYRDGRQIAVERPTELRSARPGLRVARYFMRVTMNGALFGVARREELAAIGFPPEVGGDWLLVGAMAGRARIRTLTDVHVHRSVSGLGADGEALARSFGLQGMRARRHHLFFAVRIAREITIGPPLFPRISLLGRLAVAGLAMASILVRFTLADVIRSLLGPQASGRIERAIAAWLRRRA
jgi:cellulose synthase/poly-beta-1,6-N-acetylglucosamine synthase-like glycosyltransferase